MQKTKRAFSAIPIDQAHEQNNAWIKSDGGAVGITDNPSALRRWMIAGARVVDEVYNYPLLRMFILWLPHLWNWETHLRKRVETY